MKPDVRRYLDRAKGRVLYAIAMVGWFHRENGEIGGGENLDDAFRQKLLDAPDVTTAFDLLSAAQKAILRDDLEHPAVDYLYSKNKSWSKDNLKVLKDLESGKFVSLGDRH